MGGIVTLGSNLDHIPWQTTTCSKSLKLLGNRKFNYLIIVLA